MIWDESERASADELERATKIRGQEGDEDERDIDKDAYERDKDYRTMVVKHHNSPDICSYLAPTGFLSSVKS